MKIKSFIYLLHKNIYKILCEFIGSCIETLMVIGIGLVITICVIIVICIAISPIYLIYYYSYWYIFLFIPSITISKIIANNV